MIRKMKLEDAAVVADIVQNSLGYETTKEVIEKNIKDLCKDEDTYLVVYEDDEQNVLGFIQAEKYTIIYDGYGWNVIDLAVIPNSQHKGIGKILLSSLETYAKENNSAFIRLNSRMEREKAHGFYEHLGYTCDKIQKRFIKYI